MIPPDMKGGRSQAMIITERFVFIHMHKTGGQTLNNVISRCIENHESVGYHFPRREIPQRAASLPVVGMVRNPWSWYVSWYFFNRRPDSQNPLFSVVSDGGREGFATTVRNLINLGSDSDESRQHREKLISVLPETLDFNRGVGLTRDDVRGFRSDNVGYFSWLFDRMIGIDRDDNTFVGRVENLHDDFLGIMERLGIAETAAISKSLTQSERKNSSRHSHYSHYYDDELRQLVADKEHSLIERFGYQFETVGPTEGFANQQSDPETDGSQEFRKLLGRARNFLLVNSGFDTGPLRDKVLQIEEEVWAESDRSERFEVHQRTQSVILVQFSEHLHNEPVPQPLYPEFEEVLRPVVDHIARYYRDNGFVVRILLAKLLAGGEIEEHVDFGYSLMGVHRIHVPIVTNDDVVFHVGGESRNMRVGDFCEIDNSEKHGVENNSTEDRIHLIVDWMPNHGGLSIDKAITAVKLANKAPDTQEIASLDDLITKAFEYQRSGNVYRAQAGYRYVLDIDPDNVLCNNLMGMLYRQLRRYDEAIPYIEKAIALEPRDAKAHSNLGQALLMQGKFAESVTSFQNALSLNPNLETAQIGLQRAQLELAGDKQTGQA
jgi:tetratricopeptide (TPR) repeat protein